MTIYVNLGAVTRNWQKLNAMSKGVAGAVVKANGYGLGAEKVAEALYKAGCRVFFTATVEGAVHLRPFVASAHIYALHGALNEQEIHNCIQHNIRPVVNHKSAWDALAASGAPLRVAVHFDTGMHRLGVPEDEQEEMFARMRNSGALKVELIMSHLASKELDVPSNQRQKQKFLKITEHFPHIQTSFGNSAGVFSDESYHGDITRPGFALYGGNPLPGKKNVLENTLKIKPRLLQVQRVNKGDAVSYNGLWVAERPSVIATVEVGYNDINPLNAELYLNGKPIKTVGRNSMDMLTLDITDIELAEANFEVIPSFEGLAGYHSLTSIGQRLAKEYVYED